MKVLADILQSYTKIRRLVRLARAARERGDQLARKLMACCSSKDEVVMQEICQRLNQKKRQLQPWGNTNKKDDRLFRSLTESVSIKRNTDHAGINSFVRESFRCRAICVISARFKRRGFLPSTPVPGHKLPYRVYGYVSHEKQRLKHKKWCDEYKQWSALPRLAPCKKRLTEKLLKERCSAGAFVRLQILTDLFHKLGAAFVELPTRSLGTGVHCGSGIMDIAQLDKLRTELNGRSFLEIYGGHLLLCTNWAISFAKPVSTAGSTSVKLESTTS